MAENDDVRNNGTGTARVDRYPGPPESAAHPLRWTTILLGVYDAIAAPLLLDGDKFAALMVAGAFVGGIHSTLLWIAQERGAVSFPLVVRAAGDAAAGAVIAVAAALMTRAVGALGAVAILAVVVGVPVLCRLLSVRRHFRDAGTAGDARVESPVDIDLMVPPFDGCSTRAIIRAWTSSRAALRPHASMASRIRVAALRQAYLDELERRDPAGLRRWLESARPFSGDPGRFFRRPDDGGARPTTP